MPTKTEVGTITIGETTYGLRLPTDDQYADYEAWLEGDTVVEFSDDDPPDDVETIRTYGIESVTNIVDGDGKVAGYVCPECEQEVLLDQAVRYDDGYRGCTTFGCDVVVACGDVLAEGLGDGGPGDEWKGSAVHHSPLPIGAVKGEAR